MTQAAASRATFLEESRLSAAAAAARAERRNRPRHLLLLSLALLVISAALLGWALLSRARAAAAFKAEQDRAQQIVTKTDQLRLLQAEADSVGAAPREGESIHNRLSRFQELGAQAGLKNPPSVPQSKTADRTAVGGFVQRRLTYVVRDESLDNLLAWMRSAIEDIHGLEIQSVRVIPEANQWSLNVTFSRSERASTP
ncbi:MAG: hypothetical protein IT436_12515 [Phycisphaerales bacterium]|nr:hypothetical protein [Phycisphaerales bacterium]